MADPAVSVILPSYNRAGLLPRAIDSVIAQTFGDWEMVLVDDGSTDATADVAAHYGRRLGDRLTVIRQENGGSSAARNTGIDAARGRFLTFLDSDDEFLPTKLARQLALFDLEPTLGFVYSDFAYIDLDGAHFDSVFDTVAPLAREVSAAEVAPGLWVCAGDLFDVLIRGYFIATIVGMVRRDVLGSSIRFSVDQDYAEEWLFYLKVAKRCPAGYVDEPLCLHHHTEGSLARTDKHRNTLGRLRLLKEIRETFDYLSGEQSRVLCRDLAQTCRQAGYNAERAGNHREAFLHFSSSFGYQPAVRTLGALVRSGVASIWPTRVNRLHNDRSSQGAPKLVR